MLANRSYSLALGFKSQQHFCPLQLFLGATGNASVIPVTTGRPSTKISYPLLEEVSNRIVLQGSSKKP